MCPRVREGGMSHRWLIITLLLLVAVSVVPEVLAQTPLDQNISSFANSLRTIWAPVFIMLGGIVIALGMLFLLHAGPQVIMGIFVGFLVLALVAASANGTLGSWLGLQ